MPPPPPPSGLGFNPLIILGALLGVGLLAWLLLDDDDDDDVVPISPA